jgi:hypothetical protein
MDGRSPRSYPVERREATGRLLSGVAIGDVGTESSEPEFGAARVGRIDRSKLTGPLVARESPGDEDERVIAPPARTIESVADEEVGPC